MPPTPIYSAIPVLRQAIRNALLTPMAAYVDSAGRVKCYWDQADQLDANGRAVELPYAIAQSQDGGGRAEKTIGGLSWSGLVTIRALAKKQSLAEALMLVASPAMGTLTEAGYTITTVYDRPITIPPRDGVYQIGHVFRVHISST